MLKVARNLEQLRSKPSGRLLEIVLGMTAPHFGVDVPVTLPFFNAGLNASQKEAVRFALSASDLAVIHGPPGQPHQHAMRACPHSLSLSLSLSLTST